jgi:hypothetical protein
MATWKVEPTWKKSVIERNYLTKGDNRVMIETGWRWGEFLVFTEDDNPPKIEAGVDIYGCEYETELVETTDGCWEDVDYDDCDEETTEWLEEFFEEGNSWLDLEENGWLQDECEMIIDCELKMTLLNDDNEETDTIVMTGIDEETSEAMEIKSGAPWPFANATEPAKNAEFKCEACGYTTEDIMDLVENPDEDGDGAFVCPECGGKVNLE